MADELGLVNRGLIAVAYYVLHDKHPDSKAPSKDLNIAARHNILERGDSQYTIIKHPQEKKPDLNYSEHKMFKMHALKAIFFSFLLIFLMLMVSINILNFISICTQDQCFDEREL